MDANYCYLSLLVCPKMSDRVGFGGLLVRENLSVLISQRLRTPTYKRSRGSGSRFDICGICLEKKLARSLYRPWEEYNSAKLLRQLANWGWFWGRDCLAIAIDCRNKGSASVYRPWDSYNRAKLLRLDARYPGEFLALFYISHTKVLLTHIILGLYKTCPSWYKGQLNPH